MKNIFYLLAPNLEYLGNQVFQGSTDLRCVYIPKLKDIQSCAFRQCNRLRIVAGNNIEFVGQGAFELCLSLYSINLKYAIRIQEVAFANTQLTKVKNCKCTQLEKDSFDQCDQLEKIEFKALIELYGNSFQDCSSLRFATLQNVQKIDGFQRHQLMCHQKSSQQAKNVFKAVDKFPKHVIKLFIKDFRSLELANIKIVITSLDEVPKEALARSKIIRFQGPNVRQVGQFAFNDCSNLISFYSKKLTIVEESAFSQCRNLCQINLSKTLQLGRFSFFSCINLIHLKIDAKSIPKLCFAYCYGLKQVIAQNLDHVEPDAFTDCNVKIVAQVNVKLNGGEFIAKQMRFQEIYVDVFVERKRFKSQIARNRNLNCILRYLVKITE